MIAKKNEKAFDNGENILSQVGKNFVYDLILQIYKSVLKFNYTKIDMSSINHQHFINNYM